MEDICKSILDALEFKEELNSSELHIENKNLYPCLQKLTANGMVVFEQKEDIYYVPTKEAQEYIENGSPEYNVYKQIGNGLKITDITNKIGLLHAFKNKWVIQEGETIRINCDVKEDKTKNQLLNITNANTTEIQYLKRRRLIAQSKDVFYIIKKGEKYGSKLLEYANEITAEMIVSGEYKNLKFKPYNFETIGKLPEKGNLHPLMKMKEEFRTIFLSMGFDEMQTDRYVESSFWNFDALFQPQQHPSRDAHDTFFVKNEVEVDASDEYVQNVKIMHETGGSGSHGYKNKWDYGEAKKGVLRTHTTAISARYLHKIASLLRNKQSKSEYNDKLVVGKGEIHKLFSIDRVFRNESVDATHLAEFHQVEGVIVGNDLVLGELMGILESFYKKLGMDEIKFKPAYNPYTEPSMEIFAYHKELKKWIEIGNSGIFRPEMLKPMGFGDNIRVFGWGLSLERPTMIKYGIKNIRDLVGHKVSLSSIKKNEICYF